MSWALALAVGFGGTWIGTQLPVPALGWLLTAGGLAPLWAAHQSRGRCGLAGALAAGWMVACVLAHVGCAWEEGFEPIARSVPGGRAFAEARLTAWSALAGGGGVDLHGPLLALAAAAAVVLLVRPAGGFMALLAAAAAAGFAGTAAARVALGAKAAGWDPVTAALLALPPTIWMQISGALVLAAALGAPGPLRPLGAVPGRLRGVMWGAGLLVLGLLAELLLAPAWAALLEGRGALDLPAG